MIGGFAGSVGGVFDLGTGDWGKKTGSAGGPAEGQVQSSVFFRGVRREVVRSHAGASLRSQRGFKLR